MSLVEPDATSRSRDAIEAVGGRVVGVVSAEARWPLLADAERSLGWRAVSNRTMPPIGGDPMAIEGYRTIAYEIAEELRWTAPDLVLVPAALGDGIQGIWRGFRDLVTWAVIDRIPRMVAVEVAGAVAAALASGKDWVRAERRAGVAGTGARRASPARCSRCTPWSSPRGWWCACPRASSSTPACSSASSRACGPIWRRPRRWPPRSSSPSAATCRPGRWWCRC